MLAVTEYAVSSAYKNFTPDRLETKGGWLTNPGDVIGAWVQADFHKAVSKIGIINGFWELDDRADWKWHHRIMNAALNGHNILLVDSQDEQVFHLPKPSESVRIVVLGTYPPEKFPVIGMMGLRALS